MNYTWETHTGILFNKEVSDFKLDFIVIINL